MVTLKEACQIMKKVRPNEYIHVVNEFETAYLFGMVRNGTKPTEQSWGLTADIVDKRTGEYQFSNLGDERLQGNYKQYSTEDLEKL